MPNLMDEYKIIFLGKQDKPWNFPKTFSLYWSFLWVCFGVCQKPKLNRLNYEILVQGFIIPNLVNEYKTIFLGKWGKPGNYSLRKKCPYSELFWSAFFRHFPLFSPNVGKCRKNADQNKSEYGLFLCSGNITSYCFYRLLILLL